MDFAQMWNVAYLAPAATFFVELIKKGWALDPRFTGLASVGLSAVCAAGLVGIVAGVAKYPFEAAAAMWLFTWFSAMGAYGFIKTVKNG